MADEAYKVGSFRFESRLFVGTGKYADFTTMRTALDASQCQVVTVAVRRDVGHVECDVGDRAHPACDVPAAPAPHPTLQRTSWRCLPRNYRRAFWKFNAPLVC